VVFDVPVLQALQAFSVAFLPVRFSRSLISIYFFLFFLVVHLVLMLVVRINVLTVDHVKQYQEVAIDVSVVPALQASAVIFLPVSFIDCGD
jgi:hypothetical protein